jgi:hypothetical protein
LDGVASPYPEPDKVHLFFQDDDRIGKENWGIIEKGKYGARISGGIGLLWGDLFLVWPLFRDSLDFTLLKARDLRASPAGSN